MIRMRIGAATGKMFKYIFLGFVIGYAFSFISPEFNQFMFIHFIKICRWAELTHEVWAFMDEYIFYGRL